jgi:hypothetical protein
VSPYFFNSSNIFISASPFLGTSVIKLWPGQIAALVSQVAKGIVSPSKKGRREREREREREWPGEFWSPPSSQGLVTNADEKKLFSIREINIKSHFIWRKMH